MVNNEKMVGVWLNHGQLEAITAALEIAREVCTTDHPDVCGCADYGTVCEELERSVVTLAPAEQDETPPLGAITARARALLMVYRALPNAAHPEERDRTVVGDAIADLLHLAHDAGIHPGAMMCRAVRNAFEEVTDRKGVVETREYLTVRVARPDGHSMPRRRSAKLNVTVMENHLVATPTAFTDVAAGVGDDLGDHDSPEFLSEQVCRTGWRLWDEASGERS